jgi:hypothetical protein
MAIDFNEIFDDVILESGLQETVQYPTGTAAGYIDAIVLRNGLNTMQSRAPGVTQISMNEIEVYVSATDMAQPQENKTKIGVRKNPGDASYSVMTVGKIIHSDGSFKLGLKP